MANPRRAASVFGLISLVMALLAFLLGSAPFTPALGLTIVAVPLAVVSGFYGAWRIGVVSIYFSCAAWLPLLAVRSINIRLDYMLAALGMIGLGIAGALLYEYMRSVRVT